MRRDLLGKSVVVIGGALAFGAVVSTVKGNGGGVRDAIGNVSAPWLILPFVAVLYMRVRSPLRGSLVGLAASLAALTGFYVTNSVVLQLGPHTWTDDLRLTVGAGRMFFALAVMSGPFFGAIGAWWNRTRSRWLAVLVAALFVLEPLASWLYGLVAHRTASGLAPVWFGELALGVCACAATAALTGCAQRGSLRVRR
jgi:Family of unknown function (DUF6518)